jgi:hypothetical protein
MEGSGRELILGNEENHKKKLRIIDVTAENRTKHVPNRSLKCHRSSQSVVKLIFAQLVKKSTSFMKLNSSLLRSKLITLLSQIH